MAATDKDQKHNKSLVRRGYDSISHLYRSENAARSDQPEGSAAYRTWVAELAVLLDPGAKIVDLGCGAGVPATKSLADAGFNVLGIDFSEVQIERARSLVPNAAFECADMASWDTEDSTVDAVVSFYALIHLPVEDQRNLITRISRWLRPQGYFLAIFGAPMYWEQTDEATYLKWMAEAGLTPEWHRFIPEGDSGHTLVLASHR
jgi:cyclopropane fatty-acyl-phospholipid synthase-like methyltransferase